MKKIVTYLKKIVPLLLNNKPIRKILVTALASAVVFLARRLHVAVGNKEVTDALSAAIPVVLGWAVPDPRVH